MAVHVWISVRTFVKLLAHYDSGCAADLLEEWPGCSLAHSFVVTEPSVSECLLSNPFVLMLCHCELRSVNVHVNLAYSNHLVSMVSL